MGAGSPIGGVLAAALEDHRERANAVVAQARRTYVDFDVGTLEQQIRGPLADAVAACDRLAPGSGSRVLGVLFEPVVELVGQHRLGGGSHDGLMASLPKLARVLIDDPRLIFGSLANALVHIHRHGAPTDEWLDRVVAAAASGDAAMTLRAGQVAAWTLGLAHYRDSALAVASTLSEDALGAALGATDARPASETLARLREDRWWRPGGRVPSGPTVAHRVGGFRGFGGPFLAPPRVGTRDEHVIVCSNDEAWMLHADAWGATLTRAEPGDVASGAARRGAIPSDLKTTTVATVPGLAAVTVATSYQVLVVEPRR